MDRTVVRHSTAAVISTGLAAVVVATGSHLALPPLAYLTLVVLGALASAVGVLAADFEWIVLYSIWPPWALAVLLDPTQALAGGLLLGAVAGLLAVPVLPKVGNTNYSPSN